MSLFWISFCASAKTIVAKSIKKSGTEYRDIFPDTWVATDALGRKMPVESEVGPVKNDQRRVAGMFYITWHQDARYNMPSPYLADVTKVLEKHPEARLDAEHSAWQGGSYHWGEPELGYFLSKDEYVIRMDMSMLSDAGVDVLIFDVTNAVRYWEEWKVIFAVMQKMKAEGNKVPEFCFWAYNGRVITVVQDLYDKIYKVGKYKDLWFYWDGRPLLLYNGTPFFTLNPNKLKHPNPHFDPDAKTNPKNPHYGDPDYTEKNYLDYTKDVKNFFTLRTMWWGYYEWAGKRFVGTEDNWSFGYDMHDQRVSKMNPRKLVSTHKGKKEEAAVTPAQHASTMVGKCWTRKKGEPKLDDHDLPVPTYVPWFGQKVKNPEAYGIYFQQRWDEALKSNPQFLYLNDWNEWTAGKYKPKDGGTFNFMGRKSPYYFVDQYNSEFTRCIQPMKNGYTDNYYMQMAQNLRKYKGVRPIPKLKGCNEIYIDGHFNDWEKIKTEYRDTIGDTAHRDYNGYGGLHYMNNSGRNDIITCKVAVDNKKVYFLAEAKEPLTNCTDNNWMLLFIDADKNSETGWHGYDYLVNKDVINNCQTTLKSYDQKSGEWINKAKLPYSTTGNKLELAIPRKYFGQNMNTLTFDFHWADNPADLKSPISLCTNGDSAPNRRFNYRCIWKK